MLTISGFGNGDKTSERGSFLRDTSRDSPEPLNAEATKGEM